MIVIGILFVIYLQTFNFVYSKISFQILLALLSNQT